MNDNQMTINDEALPKGTSVGRIYEHFKNLKIISHEKNYNHIYSTYLSRFTDGADQKI